MGFFLQEKVSHTLRRMSQLLQIYIVSQFGCGVSRDVRTEREMPAAKNEAKQFRYRQCPSSFHNSQIGTLLL